jgi:hypothetical protein
MDSNAPVFDATRPVAVQLRGPDGVKTIRTRFPTDDEWTERQRRRKVIVKQLGRQVSETTIPNGEDIDAAMLAKIRTEEAPEVDAFEAQKVIEQLATCDVDDVVLAGDAFRVTLRVLGATTTILLKMPSAKDVNQYRRSFARVLDLPFNRQELTINLRAAGDLYRKLAATLMQMFTGQKVTFAAGGGGPGGGGSGVLGGLGGLLGIGAVSVFGGTGGGPTPGGAAGGWGTPPFLPGGPGGGMSQQEAAQIILGGGGAGAGTGGSGVTSKAGVGVLANLKQAVAGWKDMLTSLGNIGYKPERWKIDEIGADPTKVADAKGIGGMKGGAMLAAGAMLVMDGMRRGGKIGVAETTGGGALIGAKFGGPLGALIGGIAGFAAGMVRLFIKGAVEKARQKIKDLYGVDNGHGVCRRADRPRAWPDQGASRTLRPQAAGVHGRWRSNSGGRNRHSLPPRRTDGRHQSVRTVGRAESEEARRRHGGLHSCCTPTRNSRKDKPMNNA